MTLFVFRTRQSGETTIHEWVAPPNVSYAELSEAITAAAGRYRDVQCMTGPVPDGDLRVAARNGELVVYFTTEGPSMVAREKITYRAEVSPDGDVPDDTQVITLRIENSDADEFGFPLLEGES